MPEPEVALGANPRTPQIAGRYRVESEIARGGMGTVYAVVDESTGRRVALKRLGSVGPANGTRRKTTRGRPDAALLFQLEYTMLARLVHPSLIAVYDYGVDDGVPYYTMELLDGRDLREAAKVPYREACRLTRDVASSLALLHAHRLVHRDVSPRNVRVTRGGRAKVLDFGTLTPFGVPEDIAGTPPYVPPEALNGGALDHRADLYSLGAVLYFLLTGRDAFPARRLDDLPACLEHHPPPPSSMCSEIPEALDALVLSMLSGDPLARPASAAEVIERLDAIARLPPEARGEIAQAYFLSAKTVGRSRELMAVERAIERMFGGHGASMLVLGERGFGKSRVSREIAVRAQTRGATVVVVDARLASGPLSTLHALGARLLQASPQDALSTAMPYLAHLCHAVPELVAKVGEIEPSRASEAPGELRGRVIAAVKAWLSDFAARRPLVLVVDDADAADAGSQELLSSLSRPWEGSRLLVVCTAASRAAMFGADGYGARVHLGPLSENDVEVLVGSLFGGVPKTKRLVRRLFELSGGSPRGVMDLLRHLVSTKSVRYAGGVWTLPDEAPCEALPASVEEAVLSRLCRLRESARSVAEALSVASTPLPIGVCLGIAQVETGARSDHAVALLDELVTEGVLAGSGSRYGFAEETIRESLLSAIDEGRRSSLHRQIGEALLGSGSSETFDSILAGHHLLQGGDEERGAALLAESGRRLLVETDDLRSAVPALEGALAVFRRMKRPAHELATLVGPLATAAFFVDRKLATRYGPEALSLLRDATGLTRAAELGPRLGTRAALGVGVATATMERRSHEGRPATTRELFELLLRASMTLCGVASVCLDARPIEHVLETLAPLSALGRDHGATWVRDYCEGLRKMCRGEIAAASRTLSDMLSALSGPEEPAAFPEPARRLFIGGALFALGAMETFADDGRTLAFAEQIEGLGLHLYDMVGSQLRMLHHAHQGEVDLAHHYRESVEEQVVESGFAWQIEVWEAPAMLLVHLRENDVVGLKRCSGRLDQLAKELPSLEPFAILARAAQLRFRGRFDEAVGVLEGLVSGVPFVGRSAAVGLLAEVYNALAAHADAERVTRTLLAGLGTDESRFTRLLLSARVEHAHALSGLGDYAGARRELDAELGRLAPTRSPLSLGILHEARARVSLAEGDREFFSRHLAAMDRLFRPTGNPALVARCERLRHHVRIGRFGTPIAPESRVSDLRFS